MCERPLALFRTCRSKKRATATGEPLRDRSENPDRYVRGTSRTASSLNEDQAELDTLSFEDGVTGGKPPTRPRATGTGRLVCPLRFPLGLTWNWSEGRSRLGGLLVVAPTLLGPCVNSVEAPDWYVVLRPATVLDMLPELVSFTSSDFRINWPVFG